MEADHGVRLDLNVVAVRTPTKSAAINWPLPVDRRLDQLVDLANSAGAATRRNELTAAVISAATADPQDLLGLVIKWRTQRVRDVVLGVTDAAQVVEIPRYGPGRRRASG